MEAIGFSVMELTMRSIRAKAFGFALIFGSFL